LLGMVEYLKRMISYGMGSTYTFCNLFQGDDTSLSYLNFNIFNSAGKQKQITFYES
jgi:hypothetical protein